MMASGNKFASRLYQKSNGKVLGSVRGCPVLVLTVPGRKSGHPRTTPVAYFEHEGSYVVVGSAGGAKEEPDWIKNLEAASTATVQIGDDTFDVSIRVLGAGEERDRIFYDVVVRTAPFFGDYEKKAGRVIKLGILTKV